MSPSQLGTQPEAHAALGLPLYTQATSPLRRYTDLQMHHQIKHHLTHGSALFQGQPASGCGRKRPGRYWRCPPLRAREHAIPGYCACLRADKGRLSAARSSASRNRRLFIELDETLLFVPMNNAPPLPLGTPVQVSINHVNARRDTLSVKLVEGHR